MQNSGMENSKTASSVDSHIKILVVDDHPNTANMLARVIARLGSHVEVVSATSGSEALQYVEDEAADILITDMMMPEMTGLELIEMLNDRPSITPTLTFLLTAHDSAGVREIAQQLNVKQVISKPAHPEQVSHIIKEAMKEIKRVKAINKKSGGLKLAHANTNTEPKQEELNISQLLWDVAKKFQSHADIKNQLLVVGNTEHNAIVHGNAVQLRQALRNLVWSAIQNTPKGGTVTLSSGNESNMVKIQVRDTGYGISSTDLPKILDDSELIAGDEIEDKDTTDQTLAIVNLIAKRHNGAISVESEPGKGSCFTLSLPLFQMKETIPVGIERYQQ